MIALHIDVDNIWMYEREFGISILANKGYIYTHSLPIFLRLLKKTGSKATFMIIGQDLALSSCQAFCKQAIRQGHEIANHSYSHPISFGSLSYKQKEKEILRTHEMITKICGVTPVGFRGPGYYYDKEIIAILHKLNYEYDSSALPGFAYLLMSTYAYLKGGENRHKTFGRFDYLMNKASTYAVSGLDPNKTITEFPISILPIVRLPINTTFAYFFGSMYRRIILSYIKSKPTYMLYLLHAIDFVDIPIQGKNYPVIPLRYSFQERVAFIEKILDLLVKINSGPLQTTRNSLKTENSL